jgi:hypothetical protein
MGNPIEFTNEHLTMLNTTADRVADLEEHRQECDRLHEVGKEHRKRSDDAMNHLTESNILLAKAVTDLNITVTKLSAKVDGGQPVIDFWTKAGTAWSFNKMLWAAIVGLAIGISAIVAAWKAL